MVDLTEKKPKPKKMRLDQLLVVRGLVPTRSQAQSLIMAGQVLVNDTPCEKAGALVADEANVRLRDTSRYVGRGGLKLEAALESFGVCVEHKTCLDIGASTGGFTDCLLQKGAKKVFAVDVGVDQLHSRLRQDPRVVVIDRCNFRNFDPSTLPEKIELVVMDVSFISATLLFPKIAEVLLQSGLTEQQLVVLVKPQFEVGRGFVGKGGIVRDETHRQAAVEKVRDALLKLGFVISGVIESPITGADGNVEYLLAANFQRSQAESSCIESNSLGDVIHHDGRIAHK